MESTNQQTVMVVEGTYQGKNLYVENPFNNNGAGFCVIDVSVNGNELTVGIESSAFEINFQPFQFSIGDAIIVTISHHPGCTPKVLNPEALKPETK